jgi:hypothetical protein
MILIPNENFEMEDMVEPILEDWKLPPSIEDEEAMPGSRPLGMTLEQRREERGELTLNIRIL